MWLAKERLPPGSHPSSQATRHNKKVSIYEAAHKAALCNQSAEAHGRQERRMEIRNIKLLAQDMGKFQIPDEK